MIYPTIILCSSLYFIKSRYHHLTASLIIFLYTKIDWCNLRFLSFCDRIENKTYNGWREELQGSAKLAEWESVLMTADRRHILQKGWK